MRGKSLELRPQLSPERMGSLAILRVAEMRNREKVNKPEMKTKVSPKPFTYFLFEMQTIEVNYHLLTWILCN